MTRAAARRRRTGVPIRAFSSAAPRCSARLLDRTFEIGIILKGLDGLLELIGGAILLAVSPPTINRIVGLLTQHELSEDPRDVIATHLLRISHGLTGPAVTFAAAYLLLHGIVSTGTAAARLGQRHGGGA